MRFPITIVAVVLAKLRQEKYEENHTNSDH
jgi:hypothetical protein